MSSVQFDTHKFVKDLMATGFTEQQAEVLADGRISGDLATRTDIEGVKSDIFVLKSDVSDLKQDIDALRVSTKADIDALRLETKTDIEGVKKDIEGLKSDVSGLKVDMAELENRLTWRMVSCTVSCTGLILAAIGALAIFK